MTFAGIILRLVQSYKYSFFLEHTYIRPSHQFGQLKQTCCWSTSVKEALLSQKKMGHLHDDISVLLRAESYKGLLSCANQGFCYASVNSSCTQPPPICLPCQSRGGEFANFALPGDQAFANLRAKPKLLTRTQFPIRI